MSVDIIYRCIPSKTLANYLHSIAYPFPPEEKASIIMSWNGPIQDKIEGFRAIMEEKPESDARFIYQILSKVLCVYESCNEDYAKFTVGGEDLEKARRSRDVIVRGYNIGYWILPRSNYGQYEPALNALEKIPWYFPIPFKRRDLIYDFEWKGEPRVLFAREADGKVLRGWHIDLQSQDYLPMRINVLRAEYFVDDGSIDVAKLEAYRNLAERPGRLKGKDLGVW